MTRRRIEQMVKTWQNRLRLDHWTIKVDWAKAISPDAHATVEYSNSYDRASIAIDPGFVNWTDEFANTRIAHELLHLVGRDLDRSVQSLETLLAADVFSVFAHRYDHENEGLVDRLACILVDLAGVT